MSTKTDIATKVKDRLFDISEQVVVKIHNVVCTSCSKK